MDLKNVSSIELVRELNSRGFITGLIFGVLDVSQLVDDLNEELEEHERKTVSVEDMKKMLRTIPTDDISAHILDEIYDRVSDYFEEK